MSKTKTRTEIMGEMKTIAGQIQQMQSDHAATVAGLESNVAELTESNATATAEIARLTGELSASIESAEAVQAKLTETEGTVAELSAAKVEAENQLTKAKAALANPAHLDASLTATNLDQKAEDAEADMQEASANADEGPKSELEIYEGMERSPERTAYFNANEAKLLKQYADRAKDPEND